MSQLFNPLVIILQPFKDHQLVKRIVIFLNFKNYSFDLLILNCDLDTNSTQFINYSSFD